MRYAIDVLLLVILLLMAAVTAASEISVIGVSRIKLRRLAAGGSKTAKIILKILEMPARFFGTILVANNIMGALIAVLVTAAVIRFVGASGNKEILISTIVASFLIIVSEVSAKTLAARNSMRISFFLAIPIKILIIVLSPIVKILEAITTVVVNAIGGKAEGKPSLISEEEIKAMIKIGETEDAMRREKYKMLSKVFDFSDAIVRNVMTSKKDIASIDVDANLEDTMDKAIEWGYSRIPVYKNDPDNIIGVINMKDLLNMSCSRGLIVLADIIYTAVFVEGSKKVSELLKEFQKGHTHIAIVTDKDKKVEGVVTLEDLLEEIVGEIEDEYDVRPINNQQK